MFVIAGASGRTGGAIAQTLLGQGKDVRVVVRDAAKGAAWRARGADVAIASLDDQRSLARALGGATGFFTLLPEDPAVQGFHAHRRRMADAIASAVTTSGVPHVALLSATAAFLADGSGPACDLRYLEDLLRAAARQLTVIRACYFQENVLAALPAARSEGVFPSFFPSADVAFPTIATRDVARLAARLLVEPPATSEVIDVLGPRYTVQQLADALGAAIGRNLRIVDIPAAAHTEALIQAGLPRQYAEALAEMFACFASGRVSPRGDRTVAATTTLEDVLSGLATTT